MAARADGGDGVHLVAAEDGSVSRTEARTRVTSGRDREIAAVRPASRRRPC